MTKSRLSFLSVLLVLVALPHSALAIIAPGDYYIHNDFFEKVLTADASDTSKPTLGVYSYAQDSCFLFTAEETTTSGYVKLRHKASGKYLTASTKDTYNVLLSDAGSGDQYLWKLEQQFSTTIVSKKNTSKRLGCDFYQGSTYFFHQDKVPVYYDKGAGALNWFSIIPANGSGFESSRRATETDVFTNEYGVREKDDYQVSSAVVIDTLLDYHIISSTPFSGTSSVNLKDEHAWLVFENVRPSKVISDYLSKVKIKGRTATTTGALPNCRVEIWMRGAVVIPKVSVPFVANTDDDSFNMALGNHINLGSKSNMMTSFTLRRGFMATLAVDAEGGDYSRVYVADHGDLTVTLPTPLYKRVTSVNIRNWHYASKSGYCSTKGDVREATKACGGSWCWNWDAGLSSSDDIEYIPIKQHLYWPGDDNFNKQSSTALMLFNEPEHSEQHTSSTCSCGGTIGAWKAYENTGKFNSTGMRIGSPSATDLSYIKEYLTNCDNMKQRCDFSCTHGYWSSEWASNLSTLKGYGRPIWITEWEYGASWTSGTNPSNSNDAEAKVFDILEKLEYNDYVERYSYYEFDTGGTNGWMRQIFNNNTYGNGLSYVGKVYARVKPHFGYKASIQHVTNWWAPSASAPVITGTSLANGKYVLNVDNGNGDCTDRFDIEQLSPDGSWSTLMSVTARSIFDDNALAITLPEEVAAGTTLRIVSNTLFDSAKLYTSNSFTLPEYRELDNLVNLSFDEGDCVSKNLLTYAKDIKDASTQAATLQDVLGWDIPANGDARCGGQFAVASPFNLGGADYMAPATDSEQNTEGGFLGLIGVWTGVAQYTQSVTLPKGTYTILFPVYNSKGGTAAIAKNLFGFVSDKGKEYFSTVTKYPVGTWTTDSVTFTLTATTTGRLSLGYEAANSGSANMPHLFVDYVRISSDGRTWPGDNPTDGIHSPATSPAAFFTSGNAIFDLSGRRLQSLPTRKGIVIVNGKKVVR